MKTAADPRASGACPSHFHSTCRTASEGGVNGYQVAGYELARWASNLLPLDMESDEWEERLNELDDLIENEGPRDSEPGDAEVDAKVLAWFDRWLPCCMALIPRRRRTAFLKGVYRYVIEDGNSIAE